MDKGRLRHPERRAYLLVRHTYSHELRETAVVL